MGWKGKWGLELQDLKIEKLKDLGLIKPLLGVICLLRVKFLLTLGGICNSTQIF